jgi:hypothetical protein
MTCSDFIEGFSDYIDDASDEAVLVEARRHRDACPSCRRYEDVYLRGRELLRAQGGPEIGEDFHPRLQHRLYHVDDERVLARSRSSSTSAALLLGVAALLMAAAWSPAWLDDPEIELSPIVVSRPGPRPLGIRLPMPSLLPAGTPSYLQLKADDLWRQPSALLFEYAPVHARYRQTGSLVRTGLE